MVHVKFLQGATKARAKRSHVRPPTRAHQTRGVATVGAGDEGRKVRVGKILLGDDSVEVVTVDAAPLLEAVYGCQKSGGVKCRWLTDIRGITARSCEVGM
jgi:hypothetical protein